LINENFPFLFAETMKRENDDQQQMNDQNQQIDNSSDGNDSGNQNNQQSDNGLKPAKRARREEEELRLLIPSKVNFSQVSSKKLIKFFLHIPIVSLLFFSNKFCLSGL
jgi:hypothetical protein